MRSILLSCLLLALPAIATAAAPGLRWSPAEYAGTFIDPALDEVSGMAASHAQPGLYWAHNDSGNEPKLILVRPNGERVASLKAEGAINTDWEDVASFTLDGRSYLLVADTGDNGGIRETLTLWVFEEPAAPKDGDSLRLAWKVDFRWQDGARDCEAVAVDAARGEVLLISKKRVPPEIYRLPLRPAAGMQIAELLGKIQGVEQPSEADLKLNPVYGRYRSQITAADLSPNGRVLAILNYHSIYFLVRQPNEAWADTLKRPPSQLRYPWLPQAEALAWSIDGRSLLVASEQQPYPILRFRVTPP